MKESLVQTPSKEKRTAEFLRATHDLELKIDDILAEDVVEKGGKIVVQTDFEGDVHATREALIYIPGQKNPGVSSPPELYRVALASLDTLNEEGKTPQEYMFEKLQFENGSGGGGDMRWAPGESLENLSLTPGVLDFYIRKLNEGEVVTRDELDKYRKMHKKQQEKRGLAHKALKIFRGGR